MKWFLRAGVTLAVGGVVAAGAMAHPEWTETLGVDVWHVSELHDTIEREKRTQQSLHERSHLAFERATLRSRLVYAILDEQLTYTEAIEESLRLTKAHQEAITHLRNSFSGATDRERIANQLLKQVEAAYEHPRCRERAVELACERATLSFEE